MSTPTRNPHEPLTSEIATPAAEVGIVPMDLAIRAKLSIMMFLQYFTWGAWFVTLGTYLGALGFSGERIGLCYGTSALGAMIAPFFVGMIADRFFATQRILAVLHLVGAGLLYLVSTVVEFGAFYPILLLYFVCYMPTLALTNSLSFSHMSSPEKQFPGVRVLGTIGWIAAGLLVGFLQLEDRNTALQVGAAASSLLGIYCLALPNTPPANAGGRAAATRYAGSGCLEPDEESVVRGFCAGLVFDLHSLAVLLRIHQPIPQRHRRDQCRGQNDHRPNVGNLLHAGHARLLRAPGREIHAAGGHARLGVRYVLFAYGNPGNAMWMLYVGIRVAWHLLRFFLRDGIHLRRQEGQRRHSRLGPGLHHARYLGYRRFHRHLAGRAHVRLLHRSRAFTIGKASGWCRRSRPGSSRCSLRSCSTTKSTSNSPRDAAHRALVCS